MGNTLLNSMVRGFGNTLGRKAANSVTSSRNRQSVPTQQSFSQKQLALIQENEGIKKQFQSILKDAELYYTNGKITEGEYNILKTQSLEKIVEVDENIANLKSVTQSPSSSVPILPVIIGFVIGMYGFFWIIKTIKGH